MDEQNPTEMHSDMLGIQGAGIAAPPHTLEPRARALVESLIGVGELLAAIDRALTNSVFDLEVQLEIAEQTYAQLQRRQARAEPIVPSTFEQATFYVDRELSTLQFAAADPLLMQFTREDTDAYELTFEKRDASLRFKFGRTHEEAVPIETEYSHLTIALPTFPAHWKQMRHIIKDHSCSPSKYD